MISLRRQIMVKQDLKIANPLLTEAKTEITVAAPVAREVKADYLESYFKRSDDCVNDYPADAQVIIGKNKTLQTYLGQDTKPDEDKNTYEPSDLALNGSLVEFTYKNQVRLMLPKESAPKTAEEFTQLAYAINMDGCGRFITTETCPPISLPLIDKLYTEEEVFNNTYMTSVLVIDSSKQISLILNLLNDAASAGDKRAQFWLHGLKVSTPVSEGHLKAQQWLNAFEKANAQALAIGLTSLPDPNLFKREMPKSNEPATKVAHQIKFTT